MSNRNLSPAAAALANAPLVALAALFLFAAVQYPKAASETSALPQLARAYPDLAMMERGTTTAFDPAAHCIALLPGRAGPAAMTPDAGGFSETTQSHLDGPAAFIVARVEREDGTVHPEFGVEARDVMVLATADGQYVLRIFEPRMAPARAAASEPENFVDYTWVFSGDPDADVDTVLRYTERMPLP